jgi:hypothetical protein
MQYDEIRYLPESEDPSLTLETEHLVAKIIDNSGLLAEGDYRSLRFNSNHHWTAYTHHLGYHGIRTLYDKHEKRNLVVPFASWLNLQGFFVPGLELDPIDERSAWGTGRGWPLRMEAKEQGALLTLDPLPLAQVKYTLEIQPGGPDALDFSVRFTLNKTPEARRPDMGASWPCYSNNFDNVQFVIPQGASPEEWEWTPVGQAPDIIRGETVGYQHPQESFFPESQVHPVGYCRVVDRAIIIMLSDPRAQLFVVNMGGHFAPSTVHNPALDFSWGREDYPLGQEIGFDGRIIYTDFQSEDHVWGRYEEWVADRT